MVYRLEAGGSKELKTLVNWQNELSEIDGFNPVIIGGPVEAPDPLNPDKKIAGRQHRHRHGARRPVAAARRDHRPGRGQRPQRQGLPQQLPGPRGVPPRRRTAGPAVRSADRRHLLHQPLVRHASNRSPRRSSRSATWAWSSATTAGAARTSPARASATASASPRASAACRRSRSGPGKYAFNTYAGNIVLVPTTNFVLHWVTGRTETHRYDESLRSIDLVTKDAYEPTLPLSVVVHIDYQKAPNVIQRFGDVKKLITQTLDPMLTRLLPRRGPQADDARAAPGARLDPARVEPASWAGSSTTSTSSAWTS